MTVRCVYYGVAGSDDLLIFLTHWGCALICPSSGPGNYEPENGCYKSILILGILHVFKHA